MLFSSWKKIKKNSWRSTTSVQILTFCRRWETWRFGERLGVKNSINLAIWFKCVILGDWNERPNFVISSITSRKFVVYRFGFIGLAIHGPSSVNPFDPILEESHARGLGWFWRWWRKIWQKSPLLLTVNTRREYWGKSPLRGLRRSNRFRDTQPNAHLIINIHTIIKHGYEQPRKRIP